MDRRSTSFCTMSYIRLAPKEQQVAHRLRAREISTKRPKSPSKGYNLIEHRNFGGKSITWPPVHGKGHMWYFSDVEFAGESESEIRMEKFQVVRELESET